MDTAPQIAAATAAEPHAGEPAAEAMQSAGGGREAEGWLVSLPLLREGLHRVSGWAHIGAAVPPLAADVVKPALPLCAYWLLAAALAGVAGLTLAVRLGRLARETGAAIVVFCLATALYTAAIIGLEHLSDDPHGAVAHAIPGIEQLQEKLGLIETKVAAIKEDTAALRKKQDEETKRADARHQELMETIQRLERAQNDAAGGAAHAIADIRDLLRPGSPEIDTIPSEQLPGLVKRIIDELKKPAANPDDFNGAVRRALAASQDRTARLDFAGAAKELDNALAKAEADDQDRARGFAALLAERGRVANLQLKYRDAAGFYDRAAEAVAFDAPAAWENTIYAGNAYYAQGDEFGDHSALENSLTAYRTALNLAPRDRVPLDWALTQGNLGIALTLLGERERGTERLVEAELAFRAALQEYARERVPLEWAATQDNLGNALWAIGQRESGTARLEEAVAAYRAALKEYTRELMPLDWARTQNCLGIALQALGGRESGTAHLTEAVAALRAALEEQARERDPLQWARTQDGLGGALLMLGKRESDTARLEEAVKAFDTALEERTRERAPFQWALTQGNLGIALENLGERESGTARLEEAVMAYSGALAVFEEAGADYYIGLTRTYRDNAIALLEQRRK